MPVAYVDIPAGVSDTAKEALHDELFEAIHTSCSRRSMRSGRSRIPGSC
jgi:hypothetical protein